MTRGYPQSQTRAVMQKKEALAFRLLTAGLTVQQISTQLRCSPAFVRRIKRETLGAERSAGRQSPAATGLVDHLASR